MNTEGRTVTPLPTVTGTGSGLGEVDRYTVPHSLEWERVTGHGRNRTEDTDLEAIVVEWGIELLEGLQDEGE